MDALACAASLYLEEIASWKRTSLCAAAFGLSLNGARMPPAGRYEGAVESVRMVSEVGFVEGVVGDCLTRFRFKAVL